MDVGESIDIRFSEEFSASGSSFKLLGGDSSWVRPFLEDGAQVRLVGSSGDNAYLLTEDATYAIKMGETSNALYLVPGGRGDSITARFAGVHILTRTVPQTQGIEEFLRKYAYNGDPNDPMDAASLSHEYEKVDKEGEGFKRVSLKLLLRIFPISLLELKQYLGKLCACFCEDETVFLVSRAMEDRILETALTVLCSRPELLEKYPLIPIQSWTEDIAKVLQMRVSIVETLLSKFSEEMDGSFLPVGEDQGDLHPQRRPGMVSEEGRGSLDLSFLRISKKAVCRAKVGLLFDAERSWRVGILREKLSTELPSILIPSIPEDIRGFGIVENADAGDLALVHDFRKEKLPLKARERLRVMFDARPQWPESEFLLFVDDLSENWSRLVRTFAREDGIWMSSKQFL